MAQENRGIRVKINGQVRLCWLNNLVRGSVRKDRGESAIAHVLTKKLRLRVPEEQALDDHQVPAEMLVSRNDPQAVKKMQEYLVASRVAAYWVRDNLGREIGLSPVEISWLNARLDEKLKENAAAAEANKAAAASGREPQRLPWPSDEHSDEAATILSKLAIGEPIEDEPDLDTPTPA